MKENTYNSSNKIVKYDYRCNEFLVVASSSCFCSEVSLLLLFCLPLSPVHDLFRSLTVRDCPFPFYFFVPKCYQLLDVYGNEWMAVIFGDYDPLNLDYLNSSKIILFLKKAI